tara:strand:- start:35937 stop:36803 length:867 start_codon:yes stop_codon:yes gene_type:complete
MKCPNCSSQLKVNDHFCGHCGQKLSLAEEFEIKNVLAQFFGNIFSFDSKVFKTLKVLFVPAKYYKLFVEGKRASYMQPLRLFIFLNIFLFGLMLSYNKTRVGGASINKTEDSQFVWGNDTISMEIMEKYTPEELLELYPQESFMGSLAFKQVAHLFQDEDSFLKGVAEKLPWLFFLLIPLLAVSSYIIERKYKVKYLMHFLFWTNIMSAFILVNSLELLFYNVVDVTHSFLAALVIFCPIFSFWSLQRVFPTKGFFRKISKWTLYTVLGTGIFMFSMIVVLTLSFFMF